MKIKPLFLLNLALLTAGTGCVALRKNYRFHDPLTAEEHFQLGDGYKAQGQIDNAVAAYSAALTKQRHYAPALLALGNVAFEKKDYRTAEKFYRRILKRDPADPGANNNLAMVYLAESVHLDRAEALAKKATLSPAYRPYAFDTLAQLYATQGRLADAQEALRQAR